LTRRGAAFAALLAALVAYYVWRESLPNLSLWWDVGIIALVLMPAVFALVWLLLPLRRGRGLVLVGIALAVFAVVLQKSGFGLPANFVKLGAMAALAWAFLELFETVAWVALVAAIIPWVDAYSVWRGPTHHIVAHQRHLFTTLSFAFPVPGEKGSANLGLPDLLFFSLFLGASVRFGLRPRWTWLALTASFGATMAIAVGFDVAGLPALPLLSLAFFVANGDLLWRALRLRREAAESRERRGGAEAG